MKVRVIKFVPTEVNNQNKFFLNLQGILSQKTSEMKLEEIFAQQEIHKTIAAAKASNSDLVLPEDDFKKVFEVVKATKGWGDVEGALELFNAFDSAKVETIDIATKE